MDGGGLVGAIRRDAERSLFRARNGIRYVANIGTPPVGTTPKDVLWRREKAQLWRYHSEGRSAPVPLLIVFSILGRSYVLDLRPGESFVEGLLGDGVDVFLLDFGVPDHVDATNTLETYVDNYLPRAVGVASDATGGGEVDVLGYCLGGVIALLGVAGHPELPVRRLAVMATPVDFAEFGGLVQVFRRGRLEIDDILDDTGNIPPEAVYRMFRLLKPTSDISNYAMLWERLWNDQFVEGFQVMAKWVRDQVPVPGALARQCVDLLLRRNALLEGEVPLGGRRVELADITCPLLNVMAEHDHIAPAETTEPIRDLVGSTDVSELRIPAGHIGLAVGRHASRRTIPGLATWLKQPTD